MQVAIVGGAGGVGASVALNTLRGPGPLDVVLVDRRPEMVMSHVMDLEQVCALSDSHTVRSGEPADVAGADIVVMAAGAPFRVNVSRHVFLEENAAIMAGVLEELPARWGGILLLVTNPVDPLVTWIVGRTGLDRRRVIGYTLNDTLRLRCGIAAQLGVHPAAVDAWAVGEHGDVVVPVWNHVRVDGRPVNLERSEREGAAEFVRTWYQRHVALDSGRSSTWTSGVGVASMIAAIAGDTGRIWPASVVLDGEYDHTGLALSVPVVLGRDGVREVVRWELEPAARRELVRAAHVVAASVRRLEAAGAAGAHGIPAPGPPAGAA